MNRTLQRSKVQVAYFVSIIILISDAFIWRTISRKACRNLNLNVKQIENCDTCMLYTIKMIEK